MQALLKKSSALILGSFIALSLMMPVVLGFSHNAQAAPGETGALKADDLFGGGGVKGEDFAASAGLGDAGLVETISSIIRIALGFLGVMAVVIILLGGFKWMASGGNDEKVKGAKKLIFSGIIGLVIVLSAYAIASFVIESLTGITAP